MADRLMRASVTIPLDSGIPDDAVVNTFYFDQDDNGILPPPGDSYDGVMSSLTQLYTAIDALILPNSVGNLITVRIYDMRDAEPRVVRHTEDIEITPADTDPFPGEVALCVSFAAAEVSGANRARRRGRVFLGPCKIGAGNIVGFQNRPRTDTRTEIAAAFHDLATPNDIGGSSLSWAIFSPTTLAGGSTIDDAFNDVESGWIDDSWDTQRRRGAAATSRVTFV